MKKVKIQGHFTVIFNRLETARLLNVAVNTLKRWEALGIVPRVILWIVKGVQFIP